jgi:voltage-gated potassium channel
MVFWAVGVLSLLIAVGIVGYIVIERWSVLDAAYMTVITLTTVGYMECR